MASEIPKQYLADSPPLVVPLAIKPHFEALSDKEKLYAHHISRAAFNGYRIIFRQVSPESEIIFDLIIALYESCKGDWDKLRESTGVSSQDMKYFLEYSVQFLYNAGNYKGFGDNKFVPRLSPDALEALVSQSSKAKSLFESTGGKNGAIFADLSSPGLLHLGFPDKGHLSTYYPDSPDITEEEIASIDAFLAKIGLLPENTRFKKLKSGDFQVLVASGIENPPQDTRDVKETTFELDGDLKGKKLEIVYGDYREEMAKVALEIKKAGLAAANDKQKTMMEKYALTFGSGSMEAFKDSQRAWVQDLGPMVESNIGFIENYRDPAGVRAEWEGFVAMVNKERTEAFGKLVASAPSMIPKLPWDHNFEKDVFKAPDFTSLEVLSFASSGIPAGINIPNQDDIRQDLGFKNVSLGNILSAKAPNQSIPFIASADSELYDKYRDAGFEVQVGIHELLGHGSGKLLQEVKPGEFNFDSKNPPISPVTNKPITTWYGPGQTWSSVFGATSSSYEECRAEAVAMALACDFSILSIFGHGDGKEDINGDAGDVLYISYLSMARAGVAALEFWDPKSKKWGQAHMQARFSILRAFLDAGDDFAKLDYTKDDLSDLTVKIDRSKILTIGRKAVEAYLQKLHVYKATADFAAGKALYDKMTDVDTFWAEKVRPVVIANVQPRKVFVQANTFEKDGKVELKEYEPTLEGMIQSFAERRI